MQLPAGRGLIARAVPVCESEALSPLLAWIGTNLAEDLYSLIEGRSLRHVPKRKAAP